MAQHRNLAHASNAVGPNWMQAYKFTVNYHPEPKDISHPLSRLDNNKEKQNGNEVNCGNTKEMKT